MKKAMLTGLCAWLGSWGGAFGQTVFLDADTVETGSTISTTPLVTPHGTIEAIDTVEIRITADPDLIAAGSTGNVFDVLNVPNSTASIRWDFDVSSVTFIYGGNIGGIRIQAKDKDGVVLDEFFQADTGDGQPAGPETLSGSGIRSIYWEDPGGNFCAIDNVALEVEQNNCTGNEAFKKVTCKNKACGESVVAKITGAQPGATLTVCLDTSNCVSVNVKGSGKAKAKWCPAGPGGHMVEIVDCGVSARVECPSGLVDLPRLETSRPASPAPRMDLLLDADDHLIP